MKMNIDQIKAEYSSVEDPKVQALINDLEIIKVEWEKQLDLIKVKRQEYDALIVELRAFKDTLNDVKNELLSAIE